MTFDTAVTTNIIATSTVVLTYAYLFFQYRQPFLQKWAMAWVVLAFRQLFLDKGFIAQTLSDHYLVLFGMLSNMYSLLLIAGTMGFAGNPLQRKWTIAGFIALGCSVGLLKAGFPFEITGVPTILFMSIVYFVTGRTFLVISAPGLGKFIAAAAFIFLGIHMLDMPIFFDNPAIAPWGFLIDGLLKFLVAIGAILVFFEKARDELERYSRLLAENATDVIYRYRLTKPRGFEYISPAVEKMTGYSRDNFKTIRQILTILPPDERQKFKNLVRGNKQPTGLATFRLEHKNGDVVWIEEKYAVVSGPEGSPVAVEGVVRDVTKRVVLEQDMARLDRLNVAGEMASNLAHEIRNPLTTVRGYLQYLGNKYEFSSFKDQFNLLLEELDRTNGILSEYLALSKNKMVDMRNLSLNAIIERLHPLLQAHAVPSKVEIKLELGGVPNIHLDDKEVKQLILNLARNAIEAMPTGGKVTISTAMAEGRVVLAVKDQGRGIPKQIRDNLGKPFLTTKENGTGLGMAICYRIANRHNGNIEIDTGASGTTVFVSFPLGK